VPPIKKSRAQVLRFGDRVFYKDWWNATTFEEYWRLWNLPVHYWMVRSKPAQRLMKGERGGQDILRSTAVSLVG